MNEFEPKKQDKNPEAPAKPLSEREADLVHDLNAYQNYLALHKGKEDPMTFFEWESLEHRTPPETPQKKA